MICLNSIKQLIFVAVKRYVFFEARTEFAIVIYISCEYQRETSVGNIEVLVCRLHIGTNEDTAM
jgi:hypothetical protein